jgi:plastocyanin
VRHTLPFLLSALLATGPWQLAVAAETTVLQSHKTFDPDTLSLQRGDTVHFENGDDTKHSIQVSSADDATEDLGLQKPGETVTHVFSHPGEYRVHCSIHPKMRLKVIVE